MTYSKATQALVNNAFSAIWYCHESRSSDGTIASILDKRYFESKYTINEKRQRILKAYVQAYDRQRDGLELSIHFHSPLATIKASLLGRSDGGRSETVEMNEAMLLARAAIVAMRDE